MKENGRSPKKDTIHSKSRRRTLIGRKTRTLVDTLLYNPLTAVAVGGAALMTALSPGLVDAAGKISPQNSANQPAVTLSAESHPATIAASLFTRSGHAESGQIIFDKKRKSGRTQRRPKNRVIIGLNNANGWGTEVADYLYKHGFRWDRFDAQDSVYSAQADAAIRRGWNASIVVNAQDPEMALATMKHYAHLGSRIIFEFGNELWWYKRMPPGVYAANYMAAMRLKDAAHIRQPLAFDTVGAWGYPVANGQMWLARALKAVPNLRIPYFVMHPYGEVNQNTYDRSYGMRALDLNHAFSSNIARHRFRRARWLITEIGFTLDPETQGHHDNPAFANGWFTPSYRSQAANLTADYNWMLRQPYIDGIFWYQTHDTNGDGSGSTTTRSSFGLFTSPGAGRMRDPAGEPIGPGNGNPTPILPRPSFRALERIQKTLKAQGRLAK